MFRSKLLETRTASEEEIAKIEAAVEERIEASVELAINSPDPKPEAALEMFTGMGEFEHEHDDNC